MTADEKAAAFDLLCVALSNQWSSGKWSWWCPSPCGGDPFATRDESIADLLAWADRIAKLKARRLARVTT